MDSVGGLDGVRVVRCGDPAVLASLYVRTVLLAYRSFFPADAVPPTFESLRDTWSQRLADPTATAFTASVGNEPVGSVMVRQDPDFTEEGQIVGLHVLPAQWGQGIGGKLHDWVCSPELAPVGAVTLA